MFKEITGICALATLLVTYACDAHEPSEEDDHKSDNRRFLLDGHPVTTNMSLEQFASCYLTCIPSYQKLLEICCQTGLSVVCSNLPWDFLKPKLGTCPGLVKSSASSSWLSLEQFAACFLTCVVNFEHLAAACCQTGLDAVCTNLPWGTLKPHLGTCIGISVKTTTRVTTRESTTTTLPSTDLLYGKSTVSPMTQPMTSHMTSPSTVTTQTTTSVTKTSPLTSAKGETSKITTSSPMTSSTTAQTTSTKPYWLAWGSWECKQQSGSCFQKRLRNCSTGFDNDCIQSQGGIQYNVGLCTETSCPGFFTTTTKMTTMPSTTPKVPCQDDPTAPGCYIPDVLSVVCQARESAWKLCRRSCGLCDTCWDYLNCTSPGAQKLFCSREEYALNYCRKTCGKCHQICHHTTTTTTTRTTTTTKTDICVLNKPVDIQLNKCGDPVLSESICPLLQNEICICNDDDVRALCAKYCDNKCDGYPYTGSNCVPARRKRRDDILNQVVF